MGLWLNAFLCSVCGFEEETFRHLFFECIIAWFVWSLCFAWLGVTLVSHNDPLLIFFQFRLCNVPQSVNDVWGAIWIAVISEVWKHRNNVIFKGGWLTV